MALGRLAVDEGAHGKSIGACSVDVGVGTWAVVFFDEVLDDVDLVGLGVGIVRLRFGDEGRLDEVVVFLAGEILLVWAVMWLVVKR